MTEEINRLLNKLDHDVSVILFDLVDENETLEGQVDELREQVARLTERGSAKGDLISKQAVINAIQKMNIPEDMCVFEIVSHIECEIATLPPAENTGEDRPKGQWKYRNDFPFRWECDKCGGLFKTDFHFCPNCGADMRGET